MQIVSDPKVLKALYDIVIQLRMIEVCCEMLSLNRLMSIYLDNYTCHLLANKLQRFALLGIFGQCLVLNTLNLGFSQILFLQL